VTFFDATLYNDARVCYERGAVTAGSIANPAQSVKTRCRALYGAAQCDLYLHEYLPGIEACEEALNLIAAPGCEQEQVRALIEATYAHFCSPSTASRTPLAMRPSPARWPRSPAPRGRRSRRRR